MWSAEPDRREKRASLERLAEPAKRCARDSGSLKWLQRTIRLSVAATGHSRVVLLPSSTAASWMTRGSAVVVGDAVVVVVVARRARARQLRQTSAGKFG